MIAFRQIHKVLGIEPLPPPKPWRVGKKRRRDSSTYDGEEAEEKKDKKEAWPFARHFGPRRGW